MNFEEMSKFLQKELELDNHWKVTLVGIGAGARDQVTLEAKDAVRKQNSDRGRQDDRGSGRSRTDHI